VALASRNIGQKRIGIIEEKNDKCFQCDKQQ